MNIVKFQKGITTKLDKSYSFCVVQKKSLHDSF